MARGDDGGGGSLASSTGASKFGKAPRAAAGGAPGPSLSERLRRQEQAEVGRPPPGRGTLTDSDHSKISGSAGGGGGSIKSGWSWASSSRGASQSESGGWSWASSSRGGGSSLRGRTMRKMAIGGGPGPNAKRGAGTGAARDDLGGGGEIQRRVLSAAKEVASTKRFGMAKIALAMMFIFVAVFQLGRWRGRRIGSRQKASAAASFSMKEKYLRAFGAGKRSGGTTRPTIDNNTIVYNAVFPPHFAHLSNLTTSYDPMKETPFFWDVHFSGESVAEGVFSRCHHLVQACEFGLRQPNYDEDKLKLFELDKTQYVNVDMSSTLGIIRASHLGLSSSRLADVIISPRFGDVARLIFTVDHPGRMFALFRHPVDRAIGMYYYLARASWDPQYNPSLSQMSIEQYARSKYIENNWLTRFLVGKPGGKLHHSDMLMAKKIIKFKCLVGLYDDIEVSMARFQRYFGWNFNDSPEGKAEIVRCRSEAVKRGDKLVLGHPISIKGDSRYGSSILNPSVVTEGSAAWNAIVRMNKFDMELYGYARKIYLLQGEQIFDVVGDEPLSRVAQPGDDAKEVLTGDLSQPAAPQGKSMADAIELEDGAIGMDSAVVELTAASHSDDISATDKFLDGASDPYSGNTTESEAADDSEEDESDAFDSGSPLDEGSRKNCQIVYVLGVEGVGHHGFQPILGKLLAHQVDPSTGIHFEQLAQSDRTVRRTIYGWKAKESKIEDPRFVGRLIRKLCPSDGARHVLILGASFPSSGSGGKNFRVTRQKDWGTMTMEEIADSETALNHPLNLRSFYRAYSRYADVKFVVLHRPFLETVASHLNFDGGPQQHINVLAGYLLMIRRFLDEPSVNKADDVNGSAWMMVCMQHVTSTYHNGEQTRVQSARQDVISDLASFLAWPQGECEDCFDHWQDSKRTDPEAYLLRQGEEKGKPEILSILERKKQHLNGIWPPDVAGLKCSA
ncbi:hypothetical protein ACHAWF_014621 [Thalassiosira exigua]